MCGIAGTTRKLNTKEVDSALSCMRHRGPDGTGTYLSDQVSVLHRRLSIIDLDERSLQPMWDDAREVAVVYNGEIYNYQELRRDLESEFTFKTTSDTEVLLNGYRKYGNKIWAKLSGMFAASVIDHREGKVILARDHAGIKPLFYHFDGTTLTWASEMRTLFGMLPHVTPESSLIQERLEDYFVLGYIPSPETLYADIHQVRRSGIIEYSFATGKLLESSFVPITQAEGSLHDVIAHAVDAHLAADVPVGLFFSGGVDSSLMAAFLKAQGKNLRSFSLVMPGRDEDHRYGQEIARVLGMEVAYSLFDDKAFDESYDGVMNSIDLPLSDIALLPTWFISKQAAKEVTVVLSGEGGDELFFGYPRQRTLRNARVAPLLSHALEWYRRGPSHRGKGAVYQRIAAQLDPAAFYIGTCSPALPALTSDAFLRIHEKLSGQDPLFLDRDFYLENMLLRKLDLMTMQHSLEGRVPLLAPELFGRSEEMARAFRCGDGGILKPALKEVLEHHIPKALVHRKKSGFGFNPARSFARSERVRTDFKNAYAFLRGHGVQFTHLMDEEWLLSEKPGIVFASIALHRAIINAGS